MSKKKHHVSYIKPEEPTFLKELKEKAGYKESPTVDTKREVLPQVSDDEKEDPNDEKPTVVVLNSGDITAEEADAFIKQKEEEEANAPADLSKRIIFRKRKSKSPSLDSNKGHLNKKTNKKRKQKKIVVSFSDNEENNV